MASLIHRKAWFGWTGKAKVSTPNVVGMKEADALAEIGRVQNPGTRTTASSAGVINAGRVISTNPVAGTKWYPDTQAIAYVVSTGIDCNFTDTGDLVSIASAQDVKAGDPVYFAAITTTTGIVINTQYYARDVTATQFKVASAPGGAALPLTTNGSGRLVRGYYGGPIA